MLPVLLKVPTIYCGLKGKKVIYDNCPRHASSSPYFRVRSGRKLFSKWDMLKFTVPRQWHERTVQLPLIYQKMSTTPGFICIHLENQSRLTEADPACALIFKSENKSRFIHSDVQMYKSVSKNCALSEYVTLMPRKCWGTSLSNWTKLWRDKEILIHPSAHLFFSSLILQALWFRLFYKKRLLFKGGHRLTCDLSPTVLQWLVSWPTRCLVSTWLPSRRLKMEWKWKRWASVQTEI